LEIPHASQIMSTISADALLNPVSKRVIRLSPSSMGRGRAISSGVRLRVRRTVARLIYPDYWRWDKWLKENGDLIMMRLK
jgi:hypothetical protein